MDGSEYDAEEILNDLKAMFRQTKPTSTRGYRQNDPAVAPESDSEDESGEDSKNYLTMETMFNPTLLPSTRGNRPPRKRPDTKAATDKATQRRKDRAVAPVDDDSEEDSENYHLTLETLLYPTSIASIRAYRAARQRPDTEAATDDAMAQRRDDPALPQVSSNPMTIDLGQRHGIEDEGEEPPAAGPSATPLEVGTRPPHEHPRSEAPGAREPVWAETNWGASLPRVPSSVEVSPLHVGPGQDALTLAEELSTFVTHSDKSSPARPEDREPNVQLKQ